MEKTKSETSSKHESDMNAEATPGKSDDWTMNDSSQCDSDIEQNSRTRGKLEQLRLVMGERRERRKQRKQKLQPYSIPIPVSVAAEPTQPDTVSA